MGLISLVLVLGLVGVIFVLFSKRRLLDMVGEDNRLVQTLKRVRWFQHHWLAGIFLFVVNAVLFFSTCLVLYVLMYFFIPYLHIVVMAAAVVGSFILWIVIYRDWEGTRRNRLKMSAVGSSFYLVLTIVFVYWFVTLKPAYPGEDTFMAAIGLILATIVTTVAFSCCFVITGLIGRK